jgi:metallo-beta-lactamase family protein
MDDTLAELEDIIGGASANGGNILIPAFAVGRTQEILFRLGELYHRGKLREHLVYLDSPMAIAATEIYQRHLDAFNRSDRRALKADRPGSFESYLPVLRYSHSPEDSMALNRVRSGAIIIAGSGMCTGGRIRHHLRHNLSHSNTDVIIVGFQARGTPGRALVDGTRTYRYGQEEIAVRATIHTLGGFSAHAGQSQLLQWVEGLKSRDTRIFLVHGEDEAKAALAHELEARGRNVAVPRAGTHIEI